MLGGVTRHMLPHLSGVPPPPCKQALSLLYLATYRTFVLSRYGWLADGTAQYPMQQSLGIAGILLELVIIIGRSTRAADSTHGVKRIKSDICLTASTMQQEGCW